MSEIKNEVISLIKKRKNVFIEGKAGTGKSTLLRAIKSYFGDKAIVLAPTGLAALNVSGQTIHSFFRLKPGYMDSNTIGDINDYLRYLFQTIRIIIIDEISMVRSDLLDAVDMTLREARRDMRVFGGATMVLFGDTGQLPSIVTSEERQFFQENNHIFYNSNAFKMGDFLIKELTHIYRQSDPYFITFLSKVREGFVSDEELLEFHSKVTVSPRVTDERKIIVCTTRAMTDKINNIRFSHLEGREFTFNATVYNFRENEYPTNESLRLKQDAKIMMLNNDMEKRWVNGTIGYVSNIGKEFIEVEINGENHRVDTYKWEKFAYKVKQGEMIRESVGHFTQYPIKLAYCQTAHKAQGATFDHMHLDLTHPIFEVGQLYVALSRARTLEGLSISRELTQKDILPNPHIYKEGMFDDRE